MSDAISRMVNTYSGDLPGVDEEALTECIAACVECAEICSICADACLREGAVADLVACIRRNLDCADQCTATARVLSRYRGDEDDAAVTVVLAACAATCKKSAILCRAHAKEHPHCEVCAEICERCEQACRNLVNALN